MTGDLPAGDSVTPAGKAAYQAFPQALQNLIASSRTLLIVPDYRANADDIPFELFHDDEGFLGTSRIIARFVSLRSLTRAIEHLSRRLPHKRALVASASRVEGWPELPISRQEAQLVQSVLAQAGWDVPAIDESRLSPQFFTDHLAYVSLLHVAAHGQVAVDEAIILPAGERLRTAKPPLWHSHSMPSRSVTRSGKRSARRGPSSPSKTSIPSCGGRRC